MREKPEQEFFRTHTKEEIWQRYCGFLDLSIEEFMQIQEYLLMDEIELVANSPLGKKIMQGQKPRSVEEFRQVVPLTTYDDYAPCFAGMREDALPEKPYMWCHTSGRGGSFKWAPYTRRAFEQMGSNIMAGFILASATRKGEVNLRGDESIIYNTPPLPYFSGLGAQTLIEKFDFQFIPPLEVSERMEFQERIAESFRMTLGKGAAFLSSMTSVLVKMGEGFAERSRSMQFSFSMFRHPLLPFRLAKAFLRAKVQKRDILPKDLWPVKAILCGGTDTDIYREKIIYYWGKSPWQFYGGTELGIAAVEGWNRKGMTLIPFSQFYEFIPEDEWLKSREDKDYQPTTVLFDQVEAGKRYEIVVTNFYGMPFIRYRIGDLLRFVSSRDEEMGVNLPQLVFEARADDVLDIAGFVRLDEKTVWQAIANSGIKYEDWTLRKEYEGDMPILHLYIELKEELESREVEHLIHDNLVAEDRFYKDLDKMLEFNPIRVTLLPRGSFQRYSKEKHAAGFDLAHLKPPHMHASDIMISDLLRLSG